MRFSLAESMTDPANYAPLATAAEQAGFTTMLIPDSIGFPEHHHHDVTTSSGHGRGFLEGKPFVEPFVLIAALGAITDRLRFATFVLKLPIRHPVLVAKQLTSLAVLTRERVSLGVGTSPWPEDYAACGVPWAGRGRRLEEAVTIIRGLSGGDYFGFEGEAYTVAPIKLCPVPAAPTPILFGGYAPSVLRRAARLGEGCMFSRCSIERLGQLIAQVRGLRAEFGRTHEPFEIHATATDDVGPDDVARFEAAGVTDLAIQIRDLYQPGPDRQPLAEKLDRIARVGQRLIR